MPLFMVKSETLDHYRFGKKDVELRAIKPQWQNAEERDIATIQCGRTIYRKIIKKIHQGSLARIFMDINYKRIFPESKTVFEAVHETKKRIPLVNEFMAFELEEFK